MKPCVYNDRHRVSLSKRETRTKSFLPEDELIGSTSVRLGFQEAEWTERQGPAMHTCKGILSTTVHSLNRVRHLAVRCFPSQGG